MGWALSLQYGRGLAVKGHSQWVTLDREVLFGIVVR